MKGVGAEASIDRVVVFAPDQRVAAGGTVQNVVALLALYHIVAIIAHQVVLALVAVELVVAAASSQRVDARSAFEAVDRSLRQAAKSSPSPPFHSRASMRPSRAIVFVIPIGQVRCTRPSARNS